MNALLEAENEALKARIKFLELKLSLQEQNQQEPKEEEFVVYDKLSRPQLRDISNTLGRHISSARRKSYIMATIKNYEESYGMKHIVQAVKQLQSEGKLKGIKIHKKSL